jgi:hypothetical protein
MAAKKPSYVQSKGCPPPKLNGVLSAGWRCWKRGKLSPNRRLALRSLKDVQGKYKGKIFVTLQRRERNPPTGHSFLTFPSGLFIVNTSQCQSPSLHLRVFIIPCSPGKGEMYDYGGVMMNCEVGKVRSFSEALVDYTASGGGQKKRRPAWTGDPLTGPEEWIPITTISGNSAGSM